jgi:integrase/recombinase XerD
MLNGEIDNFLKEVLKRGTRTELGHLVEGYRLCAQSEGKSSATIAIVEASVRYLEQFLSTNGLSADIARIGVRELRHFIVYLQKRQRFAQHRFTKPQEGHLSGHTVNGYLRALRAFWSWAQREGFVEENPFSHIKIPKAPKKIMPTFTQEQLRQIVAAMDTGTPLGYRDYIIILTFMDTGIRCSELTGLKVGDVNLEARLFKVWGKGAKERMVPFGRKVQSALWKYLTSYRPEPMMPCYDHVFLTGQGRPLSKDRVEAIVEHYGAKAGISGVRVSPHTFRHTFAIMFLRNGGNVFSLQRMMGHSTLDVLRIYVNMAQSDIQEAHRRYSPADNMDFKLAYRRGKRNNSVIEKETNTIELRST